MAATIKLDKPHSHFTNLDHITGRVILQLHSDTAISAIHVKLEGESRTRLSTPRNDRDKKKAEIEVHKVSFFRTHGVRALIANDYTYRYCIESKSSFRARISLSIALPMRRLRWPQVFMNTRSSSRYGLQSIWRIPG